MTVRINKDAINLREKLSQLDKPSGLVGEELLRADTSADAREALNLEEHLFEDFESTGIDDNATSTAVTIDSSNNVLVGKTSADGSTTTGHDIRATGLSYHTVDGGVVKVLNRTGSDGGIVLFRKDGLTVGNINSYLGDMVTGTGDVGVRWEDGNDSITPWDTTTNAPRGSAISLGASTVPFKDLYLSGGVYLGGTGAANKLDDYETGNFTPTTNSGTVTFSSANYVKVGDIVTIYINNIKFSDTTTSQTLRIESLPFAASGDSVGSVMAARVSPTEGFDSAYVGDGTGRIEFFADTSGGFTGTNRTSLTDGNSSLYIQVTYKAV